MGSDRPAMIGGPSWAGVVAALAGRGETLACAESLTGGLLTAAVVGVPGASAVFRGGIVAYATDLKATLLGVDPVLLAERGPVDPDVAAQMADGTRTRLGATWGVSTTGVAGPQPQGGQPVGRVYLAVTGGPGGPDGARRPGGSGGSDGYRRVVRSLDLAGDRAAIRAETVEMARLLLWECIGTSPA